jgi:hypothetical protein
LTAANLTDGPICLAFRPRLFELVVEGRVLQRPLLPLLNPGCISLAPHANYSEHHDLGNFYAADMFRRGRLCLQYRYFPGVDAKQNDGHAQIRRICA